MLQAPFGRTILGITAVGLLCYVAWRAMQVILDPGEKGNGWKGWAVRAAFAVSGLFYLVTAFQCGWFAWKGSTGDVGDAAEGVTGSEKATGLMLGIPFGWIPVMIAGAIFVGVGVHHFYRSWTAKFMKEYEGAEMSETERKFVKPIGVIGLAARGVTFTLIGPVPDAGRLAAELRRRQRAGGRLRGPCRLLLGLDRVGRAGGRVRAVRPVLLQPGEVPPVREGRGLTASALQDRDANASPSPSGGAGVAPPRGGGEPDRLH